MRMMDTPAYKQKGKATPGHIHDNLDPFGESTFTREQLMRMRESDTPPENGLQRVKSISGFKN